MSETSRGAILMVANYRSDTGYAWWLMENFWIQLAKMASRRSRRAILMYPAITEITKSIASAPIDVVEHDFGDRSPQALAELYRIVRSRGVHSVYLTDRPFLDPLYPLLRLWGVKRIVLHDHVPGEREPPSPLRLRLKRAMHQLGLFSCDCYVGVSEFVFERFREVAGIPAAKCTYVRNGIPPLSTEPDQPNQHRYISRELGIPEGALVVVSTGRAARYKQIDFIVECARRLPETVDGRPLYFVYCGDGPDLPRLRQRITDCEMSERFILAGHRNDVRRLLPSCDVAIHASKGEAFSLSILEYMGAGLPAVVPDNCGNAEAVLHGRTGYLYTPFDLDEVVELLHSLLCSPDLRNRLGRAAKNRVERQFTLEQTNKRFLDLIEQLEL